jgi:hypothetical protein
VCVCVGALSRCRIRWACVIAASRRLAVAVSLAAAGSSVTQSHLAAAVSTMMLSCARQVVVRWSQHPVCTCH